MTLSRERRAELFAVADAGALTALAELCMDGRDPPEVTFGPEVGMTVLEVREPVEESRFILGEVLVTRAEVQRLAARGWAMRLGDDQLATLAAAICDAEAEGGGRHASAVEALCRDTDDRLVARQRAEWAELAPTVVTFEELD